VQIRVGEGVQVRQVVHLFVLTAIMLCGLAGFHFADADSNRHATSVASHVHGDAERLVASQATPSLADGAPIRSSESGAVAAVDGSTEESCPAYATVGAPQPGLTFDGTKTRPLADAVAEDPQPSVAADGPAARQVWGLRVADLAVQRI
jgi:hypothetical protein